MSLETNPVAPGMRYEYTPVESPFGLLILAQTAGLYGGSCVELPTETDADIDLAARYAAPNERLEGDLGELLLWAANCPPPTEERRYRNITEGLQSGTLRVARMTVPQEVTRQSLSETLCGLLKVARMELGDLDEGSRTYLEGRGVLEKATY